MTIRKFIELDLLLNKQIIKVVYSDEERYIILIFKDLAQFFIDNGFEDFEDLTIDWIVPENNVLTIYIS